MWQAERRRPLAGIIGGAGGLTKTDAGTLVLAAAETYTGGTEIDAGTLRLGSGGSSAPTGILAMTGGTFDLNGNSQTLAGLRGTAGTIALGSGDLTIDQPGETVFAGTISGHRRADQGRRRHPRPHRCRELYRRHHP